jgi:hypothetical protein
MNSFFSITPRAPRRRFVALAAIVGLCAAAGSFAVNAQSTAGHVFGKAPAGDTVAAHSTTSAVQREVQVDAKGRYSIKALPAGVYDVTLMENGHALVKHPKVPVLVGRGIKVDFDCAQGQCGQQTASAQ